MEKSIESIWKKGFINEKALVAPKINALYEKKSINFVDKFIRDFKINLWGIILFTILPLTVGLIYNVFPIAFIGSALLWYVSYYGFKRLEEMKYLEKTSSSYEYIKQFNTWLQSTIDGYTKIYRFVYPAILILATLGVWEGVLKEEISANYEAGQLLFGIPIFGLVLVGLGAILLSIFTRRIYELDMNLVYGAQFRKLRDMISEMEELQKEDE